MGMHQLARGGQLLVGYDQSDLNISHPVKHESICNRLITFTGFSLPSDTIAKPEPQEEVLQKTGVVGMPLLNHLPGQWQPFL